MAISTTGTARWGSPTPAVVLGNIAQTSLEPVTCLARRQIAGSDCSVDRKVEFGDLLERTWLCHRRLQEGSESLLRHVGILWLTRSRCSWTAYSDSGGQAAGTAKTNSLKRGLRLPQQFKALPSGQSVMPPSFDPRKIPWSGVPCERIRPLVSSRSQRKRQPCTYVPSAAHSTKAAAKLTTRDVGGTHTPRGPPLPNDPCMLSMYTAPSAEVTSEPYETSPV
jgi:hypothetical protein